MKYVITFNFIGLSINVDYFLWDWKNLISEEYFKSFYLYLKNSKKDSVSIKNTAIFETMLVSVTPPKRTICVCSNTLSLSSINALDFLSLFHSLIRSRLGIRSNSIEKPPQRTRAWFGNYLSLIFTVSYERAIVLSPNRCVPDRLILLLKSKNWTKLERTLPPMVISCNTPDSFGLTTRECEFQPLLKTVKLTRK